MSSVIGQSFNFNPHYRPKPPEGKQWLYPAGRKPEPIQPDAVWGEAKPLGLIVAHDEFWIGEYFQQFTQPGINPPRCRIVGVFPTYKPNPTVEYDGQRFRRNRSILHESLPFTQEVHRLAKLGYEALHRGVDVGQATGSLQVETARFAPHLQLSAHEVKVLLAEKPHAVRAIKGSHAEQVLPEGSFEPKSHAQRLRHSRADQQRSR